MHAKGGLYLDVDVECFVPTDKLLSDSDIVLQLEDTNPKSLNNAVMASVPGHPFWLDVIQIMMDRGSRANAGFLGFRQLDTILKTTGMLPHLNVVQSRLLQAAICEDTQSVNHQLQSSDVCMCYSSAPEHPSLNC